MPVVFRPFFAIPGWQIGSASATLAHMMDSLTIKLCRFIGTLFKVSCQGRASCLWVCFAILSLTNAAGSAASSPAYAPNQILIKLKKGVSAVELGKFQGVQKSEVLRTFRKAGGVQLVRVPKGETVQNLIANYKSSGLVEFAEPDYIVHAAATVPNDPQFLDGTLWALDNYGQDDGTPGADIHAPAAWDIATSASNVVVAVLDTGVRYTHEDLAPNMWVNTNDNSHGWNAITETNDPADDEGHGTMVAGIIGAAGNNGIGVAGVAWQVQIMACKCLDNHGDGSNSTVVACMEYALTNGARIVNASFSSTEFSEAVSNAIVNLRDAGIIVVTSCGNDSMTGMDIDQFPVYPACYDMDNIVSVAATSRDDTLGYRSNFGATNVDLAAPGDQIYSTFFAANDSYCSTNYYSGTSFAAAYVSGALALLIEKYPTEDYHLIISRLLHGTDPLPDLAGRCVTGGRLNLFTALSPPIELLPLSTNSNPFQLRVSMGPNRTCVIEASTDLANWNPISTNGTATNWTFDFTDEQSTNSPQTFYRARLEP